MSMLARARTYPMLTIPNHATLAFTPNTAPAGVLEFASADEQYTLLYPYWYRSNAQGVLQVVGKTTISRGKVLRTPVGGWPLDLETFLNLPLDTRLLPRHILVRSTVFFDPWLVAILEDEPIGCFPPWSYVHWEVATCVWQQGVKQYRA